MKPLTNVSTTRAVISVSCAAIFLLDLRTPLGVAVWLLYLLPLFLTLRTVWRPSPLLLAAIGTVLTVVGFFLSPMGSSPPLAATNRGIGIAVIWFVALLLNRRLRTEAALSASEARLNNIFDQANDGIYLISADNRYLDANHRGLELLGYARDELLRLGMADVLVPHEVARLAVEPPRIMSGEPHFAEWEHVRKDGTTFPGEVSARKLNEQSYLAIVRDLTERRRAEAALRKVSRQLQQAQDDERRRIARDLHDSTAQKLAAATMNLGAFEPVLAAATASQRKLLDDSLRLIEEATQEIRTLSHALHPPLLDELGLVGALRSYVEGFAGRSGIDFTFDGPAELPPLHPEIEVTLFRVAQEALGNVHRHSGSRTGSVRLTCGGGTMSLEVCDEGGGAPPERFKGTAGVGFASMKARLQSLGGELKIDSGPRGTMLRANVPLKGSSG